MTFAFLLHIFLRDVAHEYFASVCSIYASWLRDPAGCARVRCSWRIAVGQGLSPSSLILSPWFSLPSRIDRALETPSSVMAKSLRAHLSTGVRQVYIFIDFDYEPIPSRNPRKVEGTIPRLGDNRSIGPWKKCRSESRVSQSAIYIASDVKRVLHLVAEFRPRSSVLQITLFRSGPLYVHGAIWRRRLVAAIVIAIFRSCFRMHIYIFRGRYARQYAVFTGRWAHHRPDSK